MSSQTEVAPANQDASAHLGNDSSVHLLRYPAVPTLPGSSIQGLHDYASTLDSDSAKTMLDGYNRKNTLSSTAVPSTIDVEKNSIDCERYKSLIHQFNVKVALSTFACSLIVAHASLVNAVVSTRSSLGKGELGNGIPRDIGLLFSFLAIAFHAGNIIISGRGAVLCSDPDITGNRPVEYFNKTMVLCEHLHLDGTVFFVIAVFISSFLVFDRYVYPLIFCGLSLLGVALFFSGKYREVSVVYKDFRYIKRVIRERMGRARQ